LPLRILSVWLLTCAIWSTVWLFIKIGVTDVPPATFGALRLTIALAVLAPLMRVRRLSFPDARRDRRMIVSTGVLLLGVNYVFIYWGMQFVSSGLTAVLQAMTPAFGFLLAHLLLHDEKMTLVKAGALAVGIGGIAVIFWNELQAGGPPAFWGSAAVVASALCIALGYVMVRREGSHLDPIVITTGQMASAILPLSVYAYLREGSPADVAWTARAVVSGAYLAVIGSVLGGWLNYWLLKRIGATKLLVMGLLEALVAVLLGAAILGERIGARAILGGMLIVASVVFVLDLIPAFAKAPAGTPAGANTGSTRS
jgi:drug/metabolite transporter (DMT)-like permease